MFSMTYIGFMLFGTLIHCIGVYGIITNRRNLLMLLMATELALLGVALNFAFVSVFEGNASGQVMALFILVVAAAESAIGLAIIILTYRTSGNISMLRKYRLRG